MRNTSRRRRIQLLCCALVALAAFSLAAEPSVTNEGTVAVSMEPEEHSNVSKKPQMSGESALPQFLSAPILIFPILLTAAPSMQTLRPCHATWRPRQVARPT